MNIINPRTWRDLFKPSRERQARKQGYAPAHSDLTFAEQSILSHGDVHGLPAEQQIALPMQGALAPPPYAASLGVRGDKLGKGIIRDPAGGVIYYNPARPLASGSFGRFFAGLTETNEAVGVKIVTLLPPKKNAGKKPTASEPSFVSNELGLMRRVRSGLSPTRVVVTARQSGTGFLDNKVLMVMPLMATSLYDCIPAFQGTALGSLVVRDMMQQLSDELAKVHGENVVHCDIKSQNLLARDGRVWLADYGLAQDLRDQPLRCSGTPEYAAPEVLLRHPFNAKADVWSLGVTMLEALCGRNPFRPSSRHGPMDSRQRAAYALKQQEVWSEFYLGFAGPQNHKFVSVIDTVQAMEVESGQPFAELLGSMLNPDPLRRASAADIAERLRVLPPLTGFESQRVAKFWHGQRQIETVAALEIKSLRRRRADAVRQAHRIPVPTPA